MKNIKQLLIDIKEGKDKKSLIKQLQYIVWEDRLPVMNDQKKEILAQLAYDLDFYEPEKVKRLEDSAYYDNKHLVDLINKVLDNFDNLA